jgi:hypothetical protein
MPFIAMDMNWNFWFGCGFILKRQAFKLPHLRLLTATLPAMLAHNFNYRIG